MSGWIEVNGVAVCLHIEVKVDDEQRESQKVFERVLTGHGGIYVVAHSVEEAVEGIDRFIRR